MAKSGGKLILLSIVMIAIGIPCAYAVDQTKGQIAAALIWASLLLCLGGAALFILGLVKLVAGMIRRA